MKPSTLILVGGAAVAGFLIWRAMRSSSAPAPSKPKSCATTTGPTNQTVVGLLSKSNVSLTCQGITLGAAAPVMTAPPVLTAPKPLAPITTAPTAPKATTTTSTRTTLSSISYYGKVSI